MTSKKEKEFSIIYNAIFVECTIKCEKCNFEIREYNTDDYYLAEKVIKEGWGVKRNKVLCPKDR